MSSFETTNILMILKTIKCSWKASFYCIAKFAIKSARINRKRNHCSQNEKLTWSKQNYGKNNVVIWLNKNSKSSDFIERKKLRRNRKYLENSNKSNF